MIVYDEVSSKPIGENEDDNFLHKFYDFLHTWGQFFITFLRELWKYIFFGFNYFVKGLIWTMHTLVDVFIILADSSSIGLIEMRQLVGDAFDVNSENYKINESKFY